MNKTAFEIEIWCNCHNWSILHTLPHIFEW